MALVRMNPALAHFSLAMSLKILSWLPEKTLLRLRCVCKSWKSLMLDLSFVKLHLQRSYCRDTPVLFTLLNSNSKEEQCSLHYYCSMQRLLDNPLSAIDDGDLPFNQKYNVVGVCNGLVRLSALTHEVSGTTLQKGHADFGTRPQG